MDSMLKCSHVNPLGRSCTRSIHKDDPDRLFCYNHSPALRILRQRAGKKGGRPRRQSADKTGQDPLQLIEWTLQRAQADPTPESLRLIRDMLQLKAQFETLRLAHDPPPTEIIVTYENDWRGEGMRPAGIPWRSEGEREEVSPLSIEQAEESPGGPEPAPAAVEQQQVSDRAEQPAPARPVAPASRSVANTAIPERELDHPVRSMLRAWEAGDFGWHDDHAGLYFKCCVRAEMWQPEHIAPPPKGLSFASWPPATEQEKAAAVNALQLAIAENEQAPWWTGEFKSDPGDWVEPKRAVAIAGGHWEPVDKSKLEG